MCVLLCANPNVKNWLDPLLARIERQSLKLLAIRPRDPDDGDGIAVDELRACICVNRLRNPPRFDVPSASTHEWQKSLDALANAWSRLLLLVGWRRG
jgi:hypothetical protein